MILKISVVALTAVLMICGLAGAFVPIIPGPLLVLLGAGIYAWYTGFVAVSWGGLGILALLTLVSQALDYLASIIGAKKFGASKWGVAGSFVGGIAGFVFGGVVGIIIGPFLGAVVFELFHGKSIHSSFKIGFGTLIGFLGGAIGKIIITVTMIGIFLIQVF